MRPTSWWRSLPARNRPSPSSSTPTPAGSATAPTLEEAYLKALRCDPVSAFGGVVALSGTLDAAAAEEITKIFTEVVIAPDATAEAKAIFAGKKNLRLLHGRRPARSARAGCRGALARAAGCSCSRATTAASATADLKVVTKRAPTERELADLLFAFKVAKHVKSNAIVYAKDGATVGIGAGQMSRVDSARIAALKAADAAAAMGGQGTARRAARSSPRMPSSRSPTACSPPPRRARPPSSSPAARMRDDEVIAAADEKGLAMVFTGMRHFRH